MTATAASAANADATCRKPARNMTTSCRTLWGEAGTGELPTLCGPCHKEKTAQDVGRIRKADRQRARHVGAMKPRAQSKTLALQKRQRKHKGRQSLYRFHYTRQNQRSHLTTPTPTRSTAPDYSIDGYRRDLDPAARRACAHSGGGSSRRIRHPVRLHVYIGRGQNADLQTPIAAELRIVGWRLP